MADSHRRSVAQLAANGCSFTIPWAMRPVCFGAGIDSRRLDTISPWVTASPWDSLSIQRSTYRYMSQRGGNYGLQSKTTYLSSKILNHLSGSFGRAAETTFIPDSVIVGYDAAVLQNPTRSRISETASYREGTLYCSSSPQLSYAAKFVLDHADGEQQFRDIYGDFYVAAFVIGGMSGASLSTSSLSPHPSPMAISSLPSTTRLLYWSRNWSALMYRIISRGEIDVAFSGFDSLTSDGHNVVGTLHSTVTEIMAHRNKFLSLVETLRERVLHRMRECELDTDRELTWRECQDLTTSGLVVEVLLMPYDWHPEYQEIRKRWTTADE